MSSFQSDRIFVKVWWVNAIHPAALTDATVPMRQWGRAGLACAADAGRRPRAPAPSPMAAARAGHLAGGGVRRGRGRTVPDRGRPERPVGARRGVAARQPGPRYLAGTGQPRRDEPGAGPAARAWPGLADRGAADEPGAARRSGRASGRDWFAGPVAPRRLAGSAGALPPAELSDAARRRRPAPGRPVGPDRGRRRYPGRRLVAAALGGPPRVRAGHRGRRTGARDLGRRRT